MFFDERSVANGLWKFSLAGSTFRIKVYESLLFLFGDFSFIFELLGFPYFFQIYYFRQFLQFLGFLTFSLISF